MEESLRKGENGEGKVTFGKGKEKKGEQWKLCFLLRVPLFVSCEAWKRRQAKGFSAWAVPLSLYPLSFYRKKDNFPLRYLSFYQEKDKF